MPSPVYLRQNGDKIGWNERHTIIIKKTERDSTGVNREHEIPHPISSCLWAPRRCASAVGVAGRLFYALSKP
jgi:hypothetical protein